MIDLSTEFGARVARRLEQDTLIWLTTVRNDGMPQPSPVWFLWVDQSFVIYSQAKTQKLRNIAAHPQVALNFDGDGRGGDIIIFTATAAVDSHIPPADALAAYVEKYQQGFKRIGMTAQRFAEVYSVAVRVTPLGVRGH